MHDRHARALQHRGGDAGPEAAAAADPHPRVGAGMLGGPRPRHDLVEPAGELVQRHELGSLDMAIDPLGAPPGVDVDPVRVGVARGLEPGEVGALGGDQVGRVRHPVGRGTGRMCLRPVDADADQLALELLHLLRRLAQERHRRPPRDDPAEVGHRVAVRRERQRAAQVALGEQRPGSQVDDPLAGVDATAQLGSLGAPGQRQVDRPGSCLVGRPHVGVVGRERVQPVDQLLDEHVLAGLQRRVGRRLVRDGRRGPDGVRRRAERSEPVGGVDLGLAMDLGHDLAHRVPLGVRQALGGVRPDQVRAADAAVEHRPACEHPGIDPVDGHRVRDVVRRVSGRVQDAPGHRAGLEGGAVADLRGAEPVVVPARHQVLRAQLIGQHQPARDVVVVHVGLHDVRQGPCVLLQDGHHAVDVALRVDHDRLVVERDDVRAVTEVVGVQRDHGGPASGHPRTALDRLAGHDPRARAAQDVHRLPAVAGQPVARRHRPVARLADDEQLLVGRQLVQAHRDQRQGDVEGAGDVACHVLVHLAHVDEGQLPLGHPPLQLVGRDLVDHRGSSRGRSGGVA